MLGVTPLQKVDESNHAPAMTADPSETAEMKNISVIVADDVDGIQDLVGHWLKDAGHLVMCVSTGQAAARLVKKQHFDIVITDIIMPDEDGLELILELKEAQPSVRILAISGGGRHVQAADCLKMARNLGAHGGLLKPFNREQLLEAVKLVLPDRGVDAS
jgi:CheY-like chemotaxis protein